MASMIQYACAMPLLLLPFLSSFLNTSNFQHLPFPSIFSSFHSCSALLDGPKCAGPQFNLLPDAEPKDYFTLF
jgi:hypothetical protein